MNKNFKKSIKAFVSNKYLMFKGRPKDKTIALTFDDGPCKNNTEQVLNILKMGKIVATFFLVGQEAERYPEITRKICEHGHEIGIHSFTHADFSKLSFTDIKAEIEKTRLVIKKITGKTVNIFRSPEGKIGFKLLLYSLLNRIRLVQWSADISDSFVSSSEEVMSRFDKLPLQKGDIILLHDDSEHTVNALPGIISRIKDNGFAFVTISRLSESS